MKKLLALVLSMLLLVSCFAMAVVAAEETTAEETTEGEAPSYSATRVVFDNNTKDMKILGSQNGINKTFFKSEWEGAKLKLTDVGDPYVVINMNMYAKKAGVDKVDSQEYPFVAFKLKIEGYVDDIELFYSAGAISGPDPAYASTTDWPCSCTGEVEYIVYDLTDDCEGAYNQFRFDPMGAEEETVIYLYEMAFFKTEEEAIAYAGFEEETEEETPEPEEVTTEKPTEEETTKAPVSTRAPKEEEEKGGCGSVVSISAVVAIIALGVVCTKKKD
jgi:hypothetical protein